MADKVTDEWAAASHHHNSAAASGSSSVSVDASQVVPVHDAAQSNDYFDLLQLTEEMLAGRNAGRTSTVVTALVQYIIRSWRDHYARTVAMKFNCFYLMPFLDEFPAYLRQELDELYSDEDSDVGEMFDIQEARNALQARRTELEAECAANSKLQRRFDMINAQLRKSSSSSSSSAEGVSASLSSVENYESDSDSSSVSGGADPVSINFMRESPHFGKWNKQGQTLEDI